MLTDWMNEEHLKILHAITFCLRVHATLSLPLSLFLSVAHTLFTGQRVREKKERKKEK